MRFTHAITEAKNLMVSNPITGEAMLLIVRRDGSKHWVLFDAEDVLLVKGYRWKIRNDGYVDSILKRVNGKQGTLLFHRLVMGFPKGFVDHKNHNRLDNRKSKLRVCSRTQNQRNRKNTESYLGVRWHKQNKPLLPAIGLLIRLILISLPSIFLN